MVTLNWLRKTKIAKPQDASFTDVREGDIIVLVIGPTGAGRSTFINSYLNKNEAQVGHDLEPCTAALQAFCIPLQPSEDLGPNRRLVLVDTPGFNNGKEDDLEVLRRIAVWLESSYGAGTTCDGIIYLHAITDARMRGTTLPVFQRLCGKKNLEAVVFGTTKSDGLTPEAFARRESQLREQYWKESIKQGARVFKLLSSQESARELVATVLERVKDSERRVLPIQMLDESMAHQKRSPGWPYGIWGGGRSRQN